jgi:ligand-binding sensor domain-containing protein
MKIRYFLFLIILTIILLSKNSFAQKPGLVFEKIPDNNEKSIGYITDITQDKYGFIWFTTLNGLYRYDGYDFKIFRNIYNDSTSLPFNSFNALFIDSDDIIWLICRDNDGRNTKNIFQFNPKNKFKKIENIATEDMMDPAQIIEDKKNNLWISTWSSGIFKYNKQTKKSETYCKSFPKYEKGIYGLINSISVNDNIIADLSKVTDNQNLQKTFIVEKIQLF